MRPLFRRIVYALVILCCLLIIIRFPLNRYEWMLEADPAMTLPLDNNASMYPWFALAPVSLLVLCTVLAKSKQEKVTLIVTGIFLLCIWSYRFRTLLF